MSLIEIILITVLIICLIILARVEAYKQGYAAGEIDGAERMWNDLTQYKEDRVNKYDSIRN